ncbi:uncharacterized protein LOC141674453 [Apium graveolens]|uniref:uncharacterized protein LOC141674453 n=1 Tax=Apium graveolens TaxID=4045 RepID=UPI003D7A55C6
MGTLPKDKLQARRLRYQPRSMLNMMEYCIREGLTNHCYVAWDWKKEIISLGKYTKAEAMPLATIMAKKTQDFVFNSIVCRFGIPYKLISDNGKQFDSKELRKLCQDLNIKKDFAAVYHPQSNGQTEAINKIIKHTLKAKLDEKKGD